MVVDLVMEPRLVEQRQGLMVDFNQPWSYNTLKIAQYATGHTNTISIITISKDFVVSIEWTTL